MGRLTLNVLLSFAQFEREVIGERIRDKIAASKRKGMWMGGVPPFGYRAQDGTVNLSGRVRRIDVAGEVVKKFIANPHCRFRPRSGISRSGKLCARRQ